MSAQTPATASCGPSLTRNNMSDRHAHETVGTGDGHIKCQMGHMHWGLYGAAGVLPVAGKFFALALRSQYVMQGGTWGVIGGAIDKHETAYEGAWRETREEINGLRRVAPYNVGKGKLPADPKPTYVTDHGNWSYKTFMVDCALTEITVRPEAAWETDAVGWLSRTEIDRMLRAGHLHPGFADAWRAISAQIR